MGNPIRRHGEHPSGEFTLIRNDLIRGSGLKPAERAPREIRAVLRPGEHLGGIGRGRDGSGGGGVIGSR
jgi:hypothetical protein